MVSLVMPICNVLNIRGTIVFTGTLEQCYIKFPSLNGITVGRRNHLGLMIDTRQTTQIVRYY